MDDFGDDDDDIYSGLASVTAAVNVYGATPAKRQPVAATVAAPAAPVAPTPAQVQPQSVQAKKGVCFAWQSGTCLRGESCWYAHIGESGAGRPQRTFERQDSHPGKMFVGGIPWAASDQDLVACFSPFGELVSASIVKDKMTGRSRGFGFVTFALPESLDVVFAPDKEKTHEIHGRVVDVRRAVPRGQEETLGDRRTFRDTQQNEVGSSAGSVPTRSPEEDWKRKVLSVTFK